MDVIGAADVGMNERAPDAFRDGNVRPAQKFVAIAVSVLPKVVVRASSFMAGRRTA
jgi:hypothetical protein